MTLPEILMQRQGVVNQKRKNETAEISRLLELHNAGKLTFRMTCFENFTNGVYLCALCRGQLHHHSCTVGINDDLLICDKCGIQLAPDTVLVEVKAERVAIEATEEALYQ